MKPFFFLTFLFAGLCLQAQDTLYTISGQKIPAKVLEINQTEIRYKKANNLEGPTYVVDKTDVALIEYKNGSKEMYGTGSGPTTNNDQQTANTQNPKPRVNIMLGGGWGWGWNWGWNNWGYWGGYRVWPRVRHHHHHYYRGGGHHFHYGRRGR
jgi:hypothetical protein